jgi:UDP-N-acetylmuramoyl-L-alanyl-D-glutamate--2,6-diaminopimelate ligase
MCGGRDLKLSELCAEIEVVAWRGDPRVEVTGIVEDSRKVRIGDVFVAIPGVAIDGHQFAASAVERGAAAVLVEQEQPDLGAPQVIVPNARRALGELGAAFYGYPSRRLRMIGITGTDGKTTTVHLTASMMESAGFPVGYISTVHARIGVENMDTGLHTTTPSALELQRFLLGMVEAGVEYAIIEVSSHALDQERVAGCDFDVAVMTNFSNEHLDYHGTPERYLEAKAKLFDSLNGSYRKPGTPKVVVLNQEDGSYSRLKDVLADRRYTYAIDQPASFWASEPYLSAQGTEFNIHGPTGAYFVQMPLLGRFNIYNALAACCVAYSQGILIGAIQQGLESLPGVPGRMEAIDEGQDFSVLVDFAVTPNALRNALELARSLSPEDNRVIVVFGCAGLRDTQKRPVMGEVAASLADAVIITADDPRTEDLGSIMAEIAEGCETAGKRCGDGYWAVGDRAEAIEYALRMAQQGDVVLLAGKGHEKSLAIGNEEFPWDEAEVARAALRRIWMER